LCLHEQDIVGDPSSFYHSPLALWLSERAGNVVGVDGAWFGRALDACQFWRLLPRWAVVFASYLECASSLPVTGLEALDVLARVELALSARAA
jgi:hypothetical protein